MSNLNVVEVKDPIPDHLTLSEFKDWCASEHFGPEAGRKIREHLGTISCLRAERLTSPIRDQIDGASRL